MTKIKTLGIDLAKNVFQLSGLNDAGAVVYSRRVRRREFVATVLNLDAEVICMEACGGSNHWGRLFLEQGRAVRLLPPQQVKPFVIGVKNDRNDARAIAIAGSQASIREVAVKTLEQQDIQSLHRARELMKRQRLAVANQIRGLLAEYGVVLAQGSTALRQGIPEVLEDAENGLTMILRKLVASLWQMYQHLDAEVLEHERALQTLARQIPECRNLLEVEGVGPLTASAFYATVGDASKFKQGRQVSAYLGLVPRQHSSGERQRLLGITKRGDTHLRTLMIHGARASIRHAHRVKGQRGVWLRKLVSRVGTNKAAVALANKNARVMWAMMAREAQYLPMGVAA